MNAVEANARNCRGGRHLWDIDGDHESCKYCRVRLCGAVSQGTLCTLPAGHDGDHRNGWAEEAWS